MTGWFHRHVVYDMAGTTLPWGVVIAKYRSGVASFFVSLLAVQAYHALLDLKTDFPVFAVCALVPTDALKWQTRRAFRDGLGRILDRIAVTDFRRGNAALHFG